MMKGILILTLIFPGFIMRVTPQAVTLEQCIDSALLWNPMIKEASNKAELSGASVNLARSAKYLSVYTENKAGYSSEYRSGNNYETASAGLFGEQLLWQKNKAGFSIEQARKIEVASKADLEAQIQEISLAVKLAYFSCIEQQWLFNIAGENVARAGLFVDYAKERFKSGSGKKSDILKAESDFSEALYDRNAFLNSLWRSRNELSMLSGIPVTRLTVLDTTWIEEPRNPGETISISSVLQNTGLNQYPEYRSVMSLVSAQQAKVNQARSDHYPALFLNGGYQWAYNPVLKNKDAWSATLTLRWNLFKGREIHYQVQSETIRKSILVNQAEQLKAEYMKELTNREISLNEAAEQIRLTGNLILTTTANLETATAEFIAGTGSMLELVDARVAHLQARQKEVGAITEYCMAAARLERLTGNTIQNK
ncbi:MAG TPA: TolC family protein [Bacteroidales bacterium]|nr:TolC family protein [Bacteroidales bacterium]